ncbi:sugar ABC transporter permease [Acidobacteriia bacterium AH_259_A11_L15]|nr:sugar ABC transporter permease [Acidobacteriia bacterium AH_259_A11_L15]
MLWRERIGRYGYLAPAALFAASIALVPILVTFWLSFHRQMPIFGISRFVGLENYRFLLEDARFWNALGNTAYFAAFSVVLELGLGLTFALLLNRQFRGRAVARALVLIPWAVPNVVAARFWEWVYNADFGVLNYLLGIKINWLGDPLWALHAAILADVWKTTPFVVLLLLAGLQVIPEELYQAARIDGANAWQLFRHITLPLLKPVILLVLLFRTMDAARIFDLIFVLTGGGPANETETLVVYAYKLLYRTLQFGYGSTLSVAAFLFILALSLAYLHQLRRAWELRG